MRSLRITSQTPLIYARNTHSINEQLINLKAKFQRLFSDLENTTKDRLYRSESEVKQYAYSKNGITLKQGALSACSAICILSTLATAKPEMYTSLIDGSGKAAHLFSQYFGDGYDQSKSISQHHLQIKSQEHSTLLSWARDLSSSVDEALRQTK